LPPLTQAFQTAVDQPRWKAELDGLLP